jgi:hypothetical protein
MFFVFMNAAFVSERERKGEREREKEREREREGCNVWYGVCQVVPAAVAAQLTSRTHCCDCSTGKSIREGLFLLP